MAGWDGSIGLVPYKLDFPAQGEEGGTSATGTWSFQNSTPTDVRFQNSEPGFGDTAPYSARTYANQAGSIGKQNEIQAPADLARPYQCDLDNSRPGYLAPRLIWDNGLTVSFANSPGGGVVSSPVFALGDTSKYGLGGLVTVGGGTDPGLWYYGFDVSSRTYVPKMRVYAPGVVQPPLSNTYTINRPLIPTATYIAQLRSAVPYPTIRQTGTVTTVGATVTPSSHIWVPLAQGGAVDIMTDYPTQSGPGGIKQPGTKFWHFVSFAGYTFSFEQTDASGLLPGMTVSLRDKDLNILTPATLSGIDASPELGNQPITEPIPDVICCYPPVVYGGAIYVATDRQVLKIVYDDNQAKIMVVPVNTSFTRITGNPEIFQGSLFVPSGNTLWKWTPGQLEFTPIPVDTFGDLPETRGGGIISALRVVANGLIIALQSSPQDAFDCTLLKFDAQNTFQMLDYNAGAGGATGYGPLYAGQVQHLTHFVDASYANTGTIVGFLCYSTTNQKRVIAVRESSRDPVFMGATPSKRKQVTGSHFWISPVDLGVNYGDFKQGLRVAAGCADVTATAFIRIYYQIDYEGILPDSCSAGYAGPFTGTLLEGMGKWTLAMTLNNTTAGLVSAGAGKAGYAISSLVTPALSYRSIRWMVEIVGDPFGTVYPRLTGFKFYYSETPAMYVVHSLRVRILVNDPDLADSPTTGTFAPPRSADAAYAHFKQLYTYAAAGTFVDFLDPNGDHRMGKITKFIFNGVSLMDTPDGIATVGRRRYDRMILQLAIQEAESAIDLPAAA